MKKETILQYIWMSGVAICITMLAFSSIQQTKKVNELEIILQEQQLIDSIGKQLVVSRLNIR